MADFDGHDRRSEVSLAGTALLLVQMAASEAEIGPFARRGRETPQAAANHYRAATALGRMRFRQA